MNGWTDACETPTLGWSLGDSRCGCLVDGETNSADVCLEGNPRLLVSVSVTTAEETIPYIHTRMSTRLDLSRGTSGVVLLGTGDRQSLHLKLIMSKTIKEKGGEHSDIFPLLMSNLVLQDKPGKHSWDFIFSQTPVVATWGARYFDWVHEFTLSS
ncbi:hypothetical protein Q8A73_020859 [Channa argus]|nr:hypothetical protein Q8A73_020859 [Channa argus]